MRTIAISAIYLGLSAAAIAQKPPASIVIRDAKDLRAYVISFVKPEYPFELRRRRIGGKGLFLLHMLPDGTVHSVEIVMTTGQQELDDASKRAFLQWHFRPAIIEAKVPVTFRPPRGGEAIWPFAR